MLLTEFMQQSQKKCGTQQIKFKILRTTQPQPVPYVPFRLREAAQESWNAELKAMRDAYEAHIKERYDRFTAIRNREMPLKGRRMDYTDYNSQFQPIERRE